MQELLYYKVSRYFKERYGKYVKRLCVDGGFTCPNRDGKCGTGGCIFCGERGAGDYTDNNISVREQIMSWTVGYPGRKLFVVYFQNFTNTYAPLDVLKKRYDDALCDDKIAALAIATRPDCIDDSIARLIASYKNKCDVWVELGLQTADDKTADFINRGYKSYVFAQAADLLHAYDIPIVAHIMSGLPHEGRTELAKTVDFLNDCKIWGLKLHSTYVMKNTVLEKMYLDGEYSPISMQDYISDAVYVLTHISTDVVIHRLTGDCPVDMLVAPDWNTDKTAVIDGICNYMRENSLSQGCYYKDKMQ